MNLQTESLIKEIFRKFQVNRHNDSFAKKDDSTEGN